MLSAMRVRGIITGDSSDAVLIADGGRDGHRWYCYDRKHLARTGIAGCAQVGDGRQYARHALLRNPGGHVESAPSCRAPQWLILSIEQSLYELCVLRAAQSSALLLLGTNMKSVPIRS